MLSGRSGLVVFCLLALLGGCAAHRAAVLQASTEPAPPALTGDYGAAAENGAIVYRLEPRASQVLVLVGKSGPFAAAGHVHVIVVNGLEGFARLSRRGDRADVVFAVRDLVVDPPAERSAMGGAYAKLPNKDEIDGTRRHMLGPSVLDAEKYPWVHLVVLATGPVVPSMSTRIRLTLHGATRLIPSRTKCEATANALYADGSFAIRQTDFGIQPYSILLGALRVKNRLEIRYHLAFGRWSPD